MRPYDPENKTELLTDASKLFGLGFALVQTDESGRKYLVQCGSRSLKPAETRYAVIELEALAITYAIHKCEYYLKGGKQFHVITDHKPLLGIYTKPIAEIDNPRLQNFRMKIASYDFTLEWQAGKTHEIADALSRYPVFQPDQTDETHAHTCRRVHNIMPGEELSQYVKEDEDYQTAARFIQNGGNKCNVNHPARKYKGMWDRISVMLSEGKLLMILDASRIIIPEAYINKALTHLHQGHPGIVKMQNRATDTLYWPGMNNDVEQHVKACPACREVLPSRQQEKIQETAKPEGPMTDISMDLCEYRGTEYLVASCRYSGWPFLEKLKKTDTESVLKIIEKWFNDLGWPLRIRTDGGPQFRSKFHEFCRANGIEHQTSSPYNPRSNGHGEAAVKQMKALIIKSTRMQEDYRPAITHFRVTPRSDGISPSQLMFGRNIRTRGEILRQHPSLYNDDECAQKQALIRSGWLSQKRRDFDKRAQEPNTLEENTHVCTQNPKTDRWDEEGYIIRKHAERNSYLIQTKDGKLITRNRKFIRTRPQMDNKKPTDTEQIIQSSPPLRRSTRLAQKPQVHYSRRCQEASLLLPTANSSPASNARNSGRRQPHTSRPSRNNGGIQPFWFPLGRPDVDPQQLARHSAGLAHVRHRGSGHLPCWSIRPTLSQKRENGKETIQTGGGAPRPNRVEKPARAREPLRNGHKPKGQRPHAILPRMVQQPVLLQHGDIKSPNPRGHRVPRSTFGSKHPRRSTRPPACPPSSTKRTPKTSRRRGTLLLHSKRIICHQYPRKKSPGRRTNGTSCPELPPQFLGSRTRTGPQQPAQSTGTNPKTTTTSPWIRLRATARRASRSSRTHTWTYASLWKRQQSLPHPRGSSPSRRLPRKRQWGESSPRTKAKQRTCGLQTTGKTQTDRDTHQTTTTHSGNLTTEDYDGPKYTYCTYLNTFKTLKEKGYDCKDPYMDLGEV